MGSVFWNNLSRPIRHNFMSNISSFKKEFCGLWMFIGWLGSFHFVLCLSCSFLSVFFFELVETLVLGYYCLSWVVALYSMLSHNNYYRWTFDCTCSILHLGLDVTCICQFWTVASIPPEAIMHFSLVSDSPYFQKIFRLHGKFFQFDLFPKKNFGGYWLGIIGLLPSLW